MRRAFALLAVVCAFALVATPARALHLVHKAEASPTPTPAPTPAPLGVKNANDLPDLYVRGQALAVGDGYFVFTNGDALRLRAGTIVPKLAIGSAVRLTLDQTQRQVILVEVDPRQNVADEIDVANLPRQYLAMSDKSVPLPAATGGSGITVGAAASSGLVNITIEVHVPANTPPNDDVYLSTDRSNYSPAEIRMQRVDARRFTISLGLPANSLIKYQFTRGNYQTVERDRTGGIVPPRQLPVLPNAKSDDTVARWADIS